MSALGLGLCAGLIVGVPFGPVGALALRYAIKGAFPQVWALAVGTVLAEAAVATVVALMVAEPWLGKLTHHPAVSFAFATFLTAVGAKAILCPMGTSGSSPGSVPWAVGQGAAITLINPGVPAGYLSLLLGCAASPWSARSLACLSLGVVAASGAWWIALIPVLRRFVRVGKPERTMIWARLLGVVFLLSGLAIGVRVALR